MLTSGRSPIMAAGTSTRDIPVVKTNVVPTAAGMAILTSIRAGNMGTMFAGSRGPVMAARTGARNIAVVKL